jgi:Cu(I)/Ag(I) efflux system membrane fusion protein/cobalt-zinc-cadmium efflux system membrane fusion protein
MNKYIVRTSLFWVAVIALLYGFSIIYSRRSPPPKHKDVKVEPVAAAPPSAESGQASTPAPVSAPQLAPVQLSPERMQSIGVQTAMVTRTIVTDDIRATGSVAINERLVSYVQVRFSGYIRKVFASASLQFVQKGDPLFTIYSPELVAAENEYLVALRNRNRLQSSAVEGVGSGAADLVSAAEARLRQWDISDLVIKQAAETGSPVSEILVTAPTSGYITERNALPNLYVEPATRLYTLADLSRVWVDAQLFPEDIGRVRPGDAANITVDAYPGRAIRGRIESILPQVDMSTRTGRVRIDLPNPGLRLKPGMYANVDSKVSLGSQVIVPAAAVLMTGTGAMAFLYQSDGQLVPREVQAGPRIGDNLIILKGLSPGQQVVSSANFLVDSESQLQAAAGAFTPPAPGAGNAPQVLAQQITIEFSTVPSPPQKGKNEFRVRLTDTQGKPISNANVAVVFHMAAMPAMGMAAMATKSELDPTGPGAYSGSGTLESGGTWQVTITVRRGGAVLGAKQMNVTATGGM